MIKKNAIPLLGVDWAYLSWNLVDGFLELPTQNRIAGYVKSKTFNRGHFLDTPVILLHCLEPIDVLNKGASIHELWFLYSFRYHPYNKLFIYINVPSYSVIKLDTNQFWLWTYFLYFISFFSLIDWFVNFNLID